MTTASADSYSVIRTTKSEAEELLRQRKLGFSFVRLLPKETGVRPIVNLRRRKPTKPVCSPSPRWPYTTDGQLQGAYGPAEQSINQILQAAFHILTFEKVSAVLHIHAVVVMKARLFAASTTQTSWRVCIWPE